MLLIQPVTICNEVIYLLFKHCWWWKKKGETENA